jgi:hypothetical protein
MNSLSKKKSCIKPSIIKEKSCGKIKGRVVAHGRKQRELVRRIDVTLPTVQLKRLIISTLIDPKKIDVATADVVGVHLLTKMNKKMIVKLNGKTVEILYKANKSTRNTCSQRKLYK